jgi:hypothetical protein
MKVGSQVLYNPFDDYYYNYNCNYSNYSNYNYNYPALEYIVNCSWMSWV